MIFHEKKDCYISQEIHALNHGTLIGIGIV